MTFAQIVDIAKREAERQDIDEPAGSLAYAKTYSIFTVSFFKPGDDHGAAGAGPRELFFDGGDSRYLGDYRPWTGTTADITQGGF